MFVNQRLSFGLLLLKCLCETTAWFGDTAGGEFNDIQHLKKERVFWSHSLRTTVLGAVFDSKASEAALFYEEGDLLDSFVKWLQEEIKISAHNTSRIKVTAKTKHTI